MKRHLRFATGALALLFAFNTTCYPWSGQGHMMVAGVAYRKLPQQTKNRVQSLLTHNPRFNRWSSSLPQGITSSQRRIMLFMIAATWPDQIKSARGYITDGPHGGNRPPSTPEASQNIGYADMFKHKYWHFVDVPFSLDGTALLEPPAPNAQTQIAAFRAVLSSTTDPNKLKSYDLVWLMHLVGDLHQPLHCVARFTSGDTDGDDGGNDVKIGGSGSLHGLWDGILGGSDSPSVALSALDSLPTTDIGDVDDLDVSHWLSESMAIAKDSVYLAPDIGAGLGPFSPGGTYRDQARKIAQKQIALAGARLAKIIQQELK